ncbi:hypothetical protein OBBRIDRAFT_820559 [Obba rivulosa]|uniref:U6 small nuclear RNA (adenine-(43)-N(6))-methyltransferase n=1 Tax=Obba rivulosa TaxID=1052685 RepID=A0A8E2ASK1_9APHY|nr:hypothetical protein OBBRIDRAFT_820559 [Obba rivulosa]
MHPRNPYRAPPDFASLAEAFPSLQSHLIFTATGATIDYKNDASQRRLTQALLLRDFNVRLALPEDRLCPPVPNRLNYILWLQDVMEWVCLAEPSAAGRTVRGIDIGTGASAIYPLLGCRSCPSWTFVVTDVDPKSLEFARLNVRENGLDDRICVIQSDPSGVILAPLTDDAHSGGSPDHEHLVAMTSTSEKYDFTMCNPPFYSSHEDIAKSAEAKERGPNAVCTGADVEMITQGGEVAFVCQMVRESLKLGDRCRWYTSMLGKISSVIDVMALFRQQNITNYACTELVQGQTRRWVVAWSFDDIRLPDSLSRVLNPSLQSVLPARNTLKQVYSHILSSGRLASAVAAILTHIEGLSVRQRERDEVTALDVVVETTRNTWSRAARRKKANTTSMDVDAIPSAAILMCRIRCLERNSGDTEGRHDIDLVFDWVRGKERGLFESFVNHVERKLQQQLIESTTDALGNRNTN